MHSHRKPVFAGEFDCLDDAVEGHASRRETVGQFLHALPMLAVDDHFAFAVDGGELGAGDDVDRMPQSGFGRMAVLKRFGQLACQVGVVEPAECRVHREHSLVDCQQREPVPFAPEAERFGIAHLGGIRIAMAADDDAVIPFKDLAPGLVAGLGRDEGGVGAGGGDGAVIAGSPEADATTGLANLGPVDRDAKVGIRGEHERTPFLERGVRQLEIVSWTAL